jgi:predicted Zn-dependent peptidase
MQNFKINGIDTILLSTNKFKTLSFFVVFFGEFNKEVATSKTLLTRMLSNTTKLYPTKKKIANKLFDLYDASVSVSSFPIYKTNLTMFSLDIVNPKFTNDENLLNEAINFFKEVIFNPNQENEAFSQADFNEEKRVMSDNIKNIYNNKARYAFDRLLEEMAPNEILSVSSLGTLEGLEKLTPQSLYQDYNQMINNEMVRIYVVGDIETETVMKVFKDFDFKVNDCKIEASSFETKKIEKVNEVSEVQAINQAQLMMGFRTNVNAFDELYVPMALFNMMFGGMPSSNLFRVVREENSLAYSVYSSIFFDNRLMIVNAGIDKDQYQLATDLIIKELEKYKNGDISSELLQVAKDNLISSLQETDDEPFSYLIFVIKNSLLRNYTVEEFISLVKKVTIEDVHQASKQIELDTIYFLKGDGNE